MSRPLTIGLLGGERLVPEKFDPEAVVQREIEHWRQKIDQVLPDEPDLIAVPENCDEWGGMSPEQRAQYYAARGNRVREAFAGIAKANRCYLTYPSVRVLDDGTRRNSIQLLDREGEVCGAYDKNFTTLGEMSREVKPGCEIPVFECDFGRVACAICFDLNFPDLHRRLVEANPDLIVFCSLYHGGLIQPYLAYACRAHFAGAIGLDNLPSQVHSPSGQCVATSTNYYHYVTTTVNLDCVMVHIDYNREKLSAMKHKYGRAVSIKDPGQLGSVLVSSESPDRSVDDLVREFEIQTLDPYFQSSLAERGRCLPAQPGPAPEAGASLVNA